MSHEGWRPHAVDCPCCEDAICDVRDDVIPTPGSHHPESIYWQVVGWEMTCYSCGAVGYLERHDADRMERASWRPDRIGRCEECGAPRSPRRAEWGGDCFCDACHERAIEEYNAIVEGESR